MSSSRITTLSLLIVISALAGCSTNRGQNVPVVKPLTSPISKSNTSEVGLAVVKSHKAHLRTKPNRQARPVMTLSKGDQVVVIGSTPIGPWYRVRENNARYEGWIHGNTITVTQAPQSKPSTTTKTASSQRPRLVSPRVSGRSYVNVDGVRVPSPVFSEAKPAGASARCRDGSYSFSQNRRGTCSHHGGVAQWF